VQNDTWEVELEKKSMSLKEISDRWREEHEVGVRTN
jgi:hypothetical protein